MDTTAMNRVRAGTGEILPPTQDDAAAAAVLPALTPAGAAALATARALAQKATAAATLRAYKADWTHFSQWCAAHGFIPVPAAPATVGAYLASLAETHAPTTIRRRLSALGKMHRFNDLAWNPAHRDESMQDPGGITRPLIELDYRWWAGSPDNNGGTHLRACRSAPQYEHRGRAARSSCSSASAVSCSCAWPRSR